VQAGAFQADRLSPSHPGVGDGNDEEKVVACAGQQGGALGDQQRLQGCDPLPRRAAVYPAPGPAAAVPRSQRRVVREEWWLAGRCVTQDCAEQAPGFLRCAPGYAFRGWQRVLPFGYADGGERVQRAVAPPGADEGFQPSASCPGRGR
jgi:hypothetical protein